MSYLTTEQTILTRMATIEARQETDHVRIKEIKTATAPMQELVVTVKHLTSQLVRQNDSMDKFVESFRDSAKTQGERLGDTEKIVARLAIVIEKQNKRIEDIEDKMEEAQSRKGKLGENILEKVVMVITAALVGYMLVQIGLIQ